MKRHPFAIHRPTWSDAVRGCRLVRWCAEQDLPFWGDHWDVRFLLCTQLRRLAVNRVMDVGCGVGLILRESPAPNRLGVDLDPAAVKKARSLTPGAEFLVADARQVASGTGTMDIVLLAHVLNRERLDLVAAARRWLRPGGILLVTTPNGGSPRDRTAHHPTVQELTRALGPAFTYRIIGYNPMWWVPGPVRAATARFALGRYLVELALWVLAQVLPPQVGSGILVIARPQGDIT